jgi:hypothetical protein
MLWSNPFGEQFRRDAEARPQIADADFERREPMASLPALEPHPTDNEARIGFARRYRLHFNLLAASLGRLTEAIVRDDYSDRKRDSFALYGGGAAG